MADTTLRSYSDAEEARQARYRMLSMPVLLDTCQRLDAVARRAELACQEAYGDEGTTDAELERLDAERRTSQREMWSARAVLSAKVQERSDV